MIRSARRAPRALLVGDNRRAPNWGGRSAGLALVDLLGQAFALTGTIEGREFRLDSAGYGIVGTLAPARLDHLSLHAWLNRSRHRLFEWYTRLERAAGADDFVCASPVQTVERILRYRSHIPEIDALYHKVAEADVVIVNGEGDFVFTTPPRREALFMLAIMELALRLDKAVFFINAMISDCPTTGPNPATLAETARILNRCARVTLRDPESIEFVRDRMAGVQPELVPDALFAWYPRMRKLALGLPDDGDLILPHPTRPQSLGALDFSRSYVAVGGTAAAYGNRARAIACYSRLVQRIATLGYPVYLTENDGPDEFLQVVAELTGAPVVPVLTPIHAAAGVLGRARLFVSGRYHPTILASLAGTPCVFLDSTAHKMRSLQALLGYQPARTFSAFPSDSEVDEAVELAGHYLNAGDSMRSRTVELAARRCREVMGLPSLLAGEAGLVADRVAGQGR